MTIHGVTKSVTIPLQTQLNGTAAPEKSLAAMREIANFSTREAIATHHRRRSLFILVSKIAVGVIGLVCGALLLHWGDDGQSWIFFGGLAGLIVSGYWFVRAGHLARSLQMLRRKSENPQLSTSQDAEIAAKGIEDLKAAGGDPEDEAEG